MNFIFGLMMLVSSPSAFVHAAENSQVDKDAVKSVMRSNLPLFKKCYDNELKTEPSIKGKVVVGWMFSDTGTVTKSWIKSSELKNDTVENCIVETVKTLQFPNAPKGIVAEVQYPLVFEPAK